MKPINPLNRHYAFENPGTVYDEEALTALELCARTADKTNECVDAFNKHLDECDNHHKQQDKTIAGAVDYMKNNIEKTAGDLFDQAVEEGVFDTLPRETYHNLTTGVFNVREYGAKGDGVTDDTEAIQDAIDASRNSGATVYLPAGIYNISDTLIIYSHTKLVGSGKRGTSETGYSGTQINYSGDDAVISTDGGASCFGAEVRNIRVNGTKGAWCGLRLEGASECYVQHFTVNGGCKVGVLCDNLTITHLDNLYLCNCNEGVHLENAHAVTVSNLNAWLCKTGIVLFGNTYNVTVRECWIENGYTAVDFLHDDSANSMHYGTMIENTSFTAGAEYDDARFIRACEMVVDDDQPYHLCVQGLVVRGCMVKINHTMMAVEITTPVYNTIATIADNTFLTNNSYSCAVFTYDKYNRLLLSNNVCADYSGNNFPIINSNSSYMSVNPKQGYVDVEMGKPIRLSNLTGTIESFGAGQLYYKDGFLRMTDGSSARIIPVQAEAVSGVSVNDITLPELAQLVNNLLSALRASGAIKA